MAKRLTNKYTPAAFVDDEDPTTNVKLLLREAVRRQDDIRSIDTKNLEHSLLVSEAHFLDKMRDSDIKYQIQFSAAKEALGIALIAAEKAVAAALEGTKEAINKADIATDKRFSLLAEKIDTVNIVLSKSSNIQGQYVTHDELNFAIDKLQTAIENTLRPVVTFMNNSTGKGQGANALWSIILGGIGAVGLIIGVFLSLQHIP